MPLTHVSPNQISGLIEALAAAPYDGKADLPDIAYEQELEVDELFPVAEAMQLLRLADVEGGDIKLTHMGKRFADAELNERKEIFSRALMSHVPLAAHIRRMLDERASHSAPKTRFLDELEDHMAEDAAEETLKTVVSWARFASCFLTTTTRRCSAWKIRPRLAAALTAPAACLARARASSVVAARASATPMRRLTKDSGLPNRRSSLPGIFSASSTPSKRHRARLPPRHKSPPRRRARPFRC